MHTVKLTAHGHLFQLFCSSLFMIAVILRPNREARPHPGSDLVVDLVHLHSDDTDAILKEA